MPYLTLHGTVVATGVAFHLAVCRHMSFFIFGSLRYLCLCVKSKLSTPLVQTVCICLSLVQTQGAYFVSSALAAFFFPRLSQEWVVMHVQVRQ